MDFSLRNQVLLAAALLAAAPARAQTNPPCDGNVTVVRVSIIKPGQMNLFLQAVAAHKAWYRSHGFQDNIIVAGRVMNRDDAGKVTYSDTEIVSLHVNPPAVPRAQFDAAWDAYVKQYRDSSDIKSDYRTCMPKLAP